MQVKDLEITCSNCNGTGRELDHTWNPPTSIRCPHCGGFGEVLTVWGEEWAQFLEKRFGVNRKEGK